MNVGSKHVSQKHTSLGSRESQVSSCPVPLPVIETVNEDCYYKDLSWS